VVLVGVCGAVVVKVDDGLNTDCFETETVSVGARHRTDSWEKRCGIQPGVPVQTMPQHTAARRGQSAWTKERQKSSRHQERHTACVFCEACWNNMKVRRSFGKRKSKENNSFFGVCPNTKKILKIDKLIF